MNDRQRNKRVATAINCQRNKRAATAINSTSSSIVHINNYLAEDCADMDVNPVEYWVNKDCDRHFKSLALKHLTPTATNVPSEEIFSSASDAVTPKRALMKPKNVSLIVFLRKNFWVYETLTHSEKL